MQTEVIKNQKIKYFLIGLFIFLRAVVLMDESRLGLNVKPLSFTFSPQVLFLWASLLVFTVLATLFIVKLSDTLGEKAEILCVMLLADPVFSVVQNNTVKFIVLSLGLVCVLASFAEKPLVKTEAALAVYMFAAAFLMPAFVYSILPLMLMFYVAANSENNAKKTVYKWIAAFVLCFAVGAGLNYLLNAKVPAFNSVINVLSSFDYSIKTKHPAIFLTALPSLSFSAWLISGYFNRNQSAAVSKTKKTKREVNLIPILFIAGYILMVIGYVFEGIKALYSINIFGPFAALMLVANKNKIACEKIEKLTAVSKKNLFVYLAALIFYAYITVWLLKENVFASNIASHII